MLGLFINKKKLQIYSLHRKWLYIGPICHCEKLLLIMLLICMVLCMSWLKTFPQTDIFGLALDLLDVQLYRWNPLFLAFIWNKQKSTSAQRDHWTATANKMQSNCLLYSLNFIIEFNQIILLQILNHFQNNKIVFWSIVSELLFGFVPHFFPFIWEQVIFHFCFLWMHEENDCLNL